MAEHFPLSMIYGKTKNCFISQLRIPGRDRMSLSSLSLHGWKMETINTRERPRRGKIMAWFVIGKESRLKSMIRNWKSNSIRMKKQRKDIRLIFLWQLTIAWGVSALLSLVRLRICHRNRFLIRWAVILLSGFLV